MAKRTGYQTSLAGLVGAMSLCLLFILGYVGLRAFTREELVVTPEAIDYTAVVRQYQESGETVLYPRSVPKGWTATSIDNPIGSPAFGLGFTTSEDERKGRFVGYKWSEASDATLARSAMGEDVTEGDDATLDTPSFGSTWRTWTHKTDTGWSTEYPAADGRTLLVWGTAPKQTMVDFINTLTTDKLS